MTIDFYSILQSLWPAAKPFPLVLTPVEPVIRSPAHRASAPLGNTILRGPGGPGSLWVADLSQLLSICAHQVRRLGCASLARLRPPAASAVAPCDALLLGALRCAAKAAHPRITFPRANYLNAVFRVSHVFLINGQA